MIIKLTVQEILYILKSSPEQSNFDWKCDFFWPKDEDKKSEIIKDIAALSNSITNSPAFIFYGVNPQEEDPIIGISGNVDDAMFQQLVYNKITPKPDFLFYEIAFGSKKVGILHIMPGIRPYIISQDVGKLRCGQLLIRSGSSTRGMNLEELQNIFISENSPYFQYIIKKTGLINQQMLAKATLMNQHRATSKDIERNMWKNVGFTPPD